MIKFWYDRCLQWPLYAQNICSILREKDRENAVSPGSERSDSMSTKAPSSPRRQVRGKIPSSLSVLLEPHQIIHLDE